MSDIWIPGALAAPILAVGIIEMMVRRRLARPPHQEAHVTYHLAIGGAVAGGPMVLTVLDGTTYKPRKRIVLDWQEWRPCEAGIKLQEHGYAILGSSQLDTRRMAGWVVLAGIGFAAEVQEIPVSPKPLGDMLKNAADSLTEAIASDPETEQRMGVAIFGPEVFVRVDGNVPEPVPLKEGGTGPGVIAPGTFPELPLNATPDQIAEAAAQLPPLEVPGPVVRQRLERLAREAHWPEDEVTRTLGTEGEDWSETRADVPVRRKAIPCEKDHPGTPPCTAGPHWGVVMITREEWEATRPKEHDA